MEKVRFGLIGVGAIVREFHLPVMIRNPRVAVVAACDLNSGSARKLAQEFDIPKTYSDFNLMVRVSEIDAVLISTPNNLHAPIAALMLESGKHVLCEKPMALTAAEAAKMREAALSARRRLVIAHPWRCDQDFQWLHSVIQSGRLGKVFKIRGHAIIIGSAPPLDNWRCNPQIAGGGALMDLGVHVIDTISFLFDDHLRPVRIMAQTANHFTSAPVEDTATLLIEFEGGMSAVVECGWHHNFQHSPHGAIEVFGTEGYARTFPTEMHGRTESVWRVTRPTLHPERPHIDASMYAAQLDSFVDCIVKGTQPACSARQGLRDMVLVDAAYQAAREGQSVSIRGY